MPHPPHSVEWFELMMKRNPHQAAMTAQIIKLAGTDEVCSICGDAGSKVYVVVSDPELTIRLCDDCKRIQKEQSGLSVNPYPSQGRS